MSAVRAISVIVRTDRHIDPSEDRSREKPLLSGQPLHRYQHPAAPSQSHSRYKPSHDHCPASHRLLRHQWAAVPSRITRVTCRRSHGKLPLILHRVTQPELSQAKTRIWPHSRCHYRYVLHQSLLQNHQIVDTEKPRYPQPPHRQYPCHVDPVRTVPVINPNMPAVRPLPSSWSALLSKSRH